WGNDEGPAWSGFRVLENTGLNVLFNVASGTPFTPTQVYNEVTLAAVSGNVVGGQNSRYGPWNVNLDFKATRAIAVYSSSGSPFTTTYGQSERGLLDIQTANDHGYDGDAFYRLAEQNPNFYSNPRLVRFGIRTSF